MKKIKILTVTLLIILITMVSFFGVYEHVQNRMENKVKEYDLDMDLKGARYIKLSVNKENKDVIKDSEGNKVETEEKMTDEQLQEKGYTKENEPVNAEESLTKENYEKAKKVISERLKAQGIQEYEISLNNDNGDILIQIPENDSTDNLVSNMNSVGKFEIIDSETKEVLMDNGDIKLANVMYGSSSSSTSNGTTVYLNIEFNKEGKEKLKNISNDYKKAENTTSNNTTSDNSTDNETTKNDTTSDSSSTTTEKKITMKIDDQEIMSTSFDEPIENGKLQLSIGNASTDTSTLKKSEEQAISMASILDSGNMPIEYKLDSNEYIKSDVTTTKIKYVEIATAIVILIGLIIFMIRYKANGIMSAISFIGMVSVYSLMIRYTNVTISIQGIIGIIATIILNYVFVNTILSKKKNSKNKKNIDDIKQGIKDGYKEFFIRIIPICISVIALCFAKWSTISSFGMIMFWGIVIIAIYNYLITATMLKLKAEK